MDIVFLGCGGSLGFDIFKSLKRGYRVQGFRKGDIDLDSDGDLNRLFIHGVEVVVYAFYLTDPEICEKEEEKARRLHIDYPAKLAYLSRKHNAVFVYFSDAMVFDSAIEKNAYSETDIPFPQSVLGKTLYAGEREIAKSQPRHLILRLSWYYGTKHAGIFHKLCQLFAQQGFLQAARDYYGMPTSLAWVARALEALLDRQCTGIYHVANSGFTNYHRYVQEIIGINFGEKAKDQVRPIQSNKLHILAKRPKYSVFSLDKFARDTGLVAPPWDQELVRFFRNHPKLLYKR